MRTPRQSDLIENDRPKIITVNGEGLFKWCSDPQVHVYRAIVKEPGIYQLHLLWLDGRKLFDARERGPAQVSADTATVPLRGARREAALRQATMEFGRGKA